MAVPTGSHVPPMPRSGRNSNEGWNLNWNRIGPQPRRYPLGHDAYTTGVRGKVYGVVSIQLRS